MVYDIAGKALSEGDKVAYAKICKRGHPLYTGEVLRTNTELMLVFVKADKTGREIIREGKFVAKLN